MECQPQNPKFRINPKNFHPCNYIVTIFKMLNVLLMEHVHLLRHHHHNHHNQIFD